MLQTVLFAKDEKKRQEVTMGTESNAEYGADQIQILEGLEAVRKRPVCISAVHRPEVFIIWFMRL